MITNKLEEKLELMYHKSITTCTDKELYLALLHLVKEEATARGTHSGKKKLYYISAEFLIGKLLSNNLINLGIYDELEEFLQKYGKSLSHIEMVLVLPFQYERESFRIFVKTLLAHHKFLN